MARYAKIKEYNISNGVGIRTAIFFTGCDFACAGCFNSELWDPASGDEFTDDTIEYVLGTVKNHISGISILGGEPLHPNNIDAVTELCKKFKQRFPQKTIWMWTGNVYEDVKDLDVMKYVDILVDGRFVQSERKPNLKWKGSDNQRVIDLNAARNNEAHNN